MKNNNRPMSAKQYRAALEYFGLTQPRAGWIFGGKSKDSGRLWPAEGAPYQVAMIIALMHRYSITPDELEELGTVFRKGRAARQGELEASFQKKPVRKKRK